MLDIAVSMWYCFLPNLRENGRLPKQVSLDPSAASRRRWGSTLSSGVGLDVEISDPVSKRIHCFEILSNILGRTSNFSDEDSIKASDRGMTFSSVFGLTAATDEGWLCLISSEIKRS